MWLLGEAARSLLEELARCSELLSLGELVPPNSCAADCMSGESRNVHDWKRSVRSSGGDMNLTLSCGRVNDEAAVRRRRGSIVGSHGGSQRQKPVGAKRTRRGRTIRKKMSRMRTNVGDL